MDGKFIIIAIVITAAVLALLIAKLASFFKVFAEETRCICREMERADGYKDYCRWRKELFGHYLCLIPFINRKNAMRVYSVFFYNGDHEREKERDDGLVPLLLPSVLGIFICLICVSGMTWAWFTASVEVPPQKISTAYYGVSVDSVKNGNDEITAQNSGYKLTAGETYTVRLTANGTVRECGGYCLIENTSDGTKTYTQTFKPKESITVVFKPSTDGTYTFTGVWGSLPTGTEEYLCHTEPVAEPVPDTSAVPDNTNAALTPSAPAASESLASEPAQSNTAPSNTSHEEPDADTPVVTEPSDTNSAADEPSA